jgi:hypothetical protein
MRVSLVVLAAVLALAPSAAASPSLDELRLEPGNVLSLTLTDPAAPVAGVAVDFGAGEDAIAVSGCGRGAPAAGEPTTLRLPHSFGSLAPREILVTVSSGGCGDPPATTTFREVLLPLGLGVATLPDLPDLPGPLRARVAQAACPGADLLPGEENLARIGTATRCLVNDVRARSGLGALKGRPKLRRAGARHVRDMLSRRYFAHVREGGPDLHARLRRAGYRFRIAGENLGAGTGQYATPRQIVTQWVLSDGHRENMLVPGYREVGVGVRKGFPLADGSPSATYALELARPR